VETEKKPIFLVVDDNPIHRDLLSNFLIARGFEVDVAANGNEALEKVSMNAYRFILMDLLMPGLSGYETVKKIRQMGVNTPIIAQSALSMKQDRDRCMEAGCDDFVPKPVDFKELWEKIRKHLHGTAPQSPERAADTGVSPVEALKGRKVLLVEENDGQADRFARFLERLGLQVKRVSTGDDARGFLERADPGFRIIVSNIFTSGIDGLGLTSIVNRQYPDKMIFLYIPEYDPDTIQLAVNLGAAGVVVQGSFEKDIGNAIENAIVQSRIKRELNPDSATADQVRQSQAQLYRYGFIHGSRFIDVSSSTLHAAGGDIVLSRRFNLAGRHGVVLADVAGHDVRSSYLSAIFMGIISSVWNSCQEPLELLKTVNADLLKMETPGYHVCMTAVLWDRRRERIKMATAGNPGAVLAARDDSGSLRFTDFEGGGMCLGVLETDALYSSVTTEFRENEFIFLHSDGIERDVLKETLAESAGELGGVPFKGFAGRILNRIRSKIEQEDDMVLVVLRGREGIPGEGYHYSFRSTYKEVDKACEWISSVLPRDVVPQGVDHDFLMLSLREALLNAVEHGNGNDPEKYVDVSLYPGSKELRVEISDEGWGFDLESTKRGEGYEEGFQLGKRGMPVIHAFADSVEVDGGTVILTYRKRKTISSGGKG